MPYLKQRMYQVFSGFTTSDCTLTAHHAVVWCSTFSGRTISVRVQTFCLQLRASRLKLFNALHFFLPAQPERSSGIAVCPAMAFRCARPLTTERTHQSHAASCACRTDCFGRCNDKHPDKHSDKLRDEHITASASTASAEKSTQHLLAPGTGYALETSVLSTACCSPGAGRRSRALADTGYCRPNSCSGHCQELRPYAAR